MNNFGNLVVKIGILALLSVLPLAAQSGDSVVFTTPFPFYAGDVKLPAGSYRLTQPDMKVGLMLIQNIAGTHGEFINFMPTSSLHAPRGTDVTFLKYGETGYLKAVGIAGEPDGMEFNQTKAEEKAEMAAENTTVVEQATLVHGE